MTFYIDPHLKPYREGGIMKFLFGLMVTAALVVGGLMLKDHDNSISILSQIVTSLGGRLAVVENQKPVVEKAPVHAKPQPVIKKKPVHRIMKRKPVVHHYYHRPAPARVAFPFPAFP